MPAIFLFYMKTFLFPKDLIIDQVWTVLQPSVNFYLPLFFDLIIIFIILAAAFWIWKINKKYFRPFLFFSLWFVIGVFFHMQIIPLDMTVADHMFYFPMVGILGMVATGIQFLEIPANKLKSAFVAVGVILIFLLSMRTIIRNSNWANGITLYSHDLKYQQNNGLDDMLAAAYFYNSDYANAQKIYEIQIKRYPNQAALYYNLGFIYEREGNFPKAEVIYKNGLRTDVLGVIYANLAKLLLEEGKIKNAKDISEQGLMKFPKNGSLLIIDAIADYKIGDKKNALDKAIRAKNVSDDRSIDQIYQGILNNNLNF